MRLKLPFALDGFTVALLVAAAVASVAPIPRAWANEVELATDVAIGLLFFLHGARLPREAVLAGAGHWRLHLTVFAATFVLFPLMGLATRAGLSGLADPWVVAGLLYLTLLPSTVQSSIALTAIGRGNVPAALFSASASNILGILITPVLVGVFMAGQAAGGGGLPLGQVQAIAMQLLAPFVVGHLSRPLTAKWIERHGKLAGVVDRGVILMVVYAAFSAAVIEGLWSRLSAHDLLVVLAASCVFLAAGLAVTTFGARALGFDKADEVAIVMCGSKKSLATGVPMAGVLFPAASVGALILPLMLFHQIQLMVGAALAARYGGRARASQA